MYRGLFCYTLIMLISKGGILFFTKVLDKCHQRINHFQPTKRTKPLATAERTELNDAICKRIQLYVVKEKHFQDKDINIGKVVQHCPFTKLQINKALRYKYDLSLSGYVNKVRIEYACVLLVDPSNMIIDVIADASGFNTTRTFERIFKAIHHVSPSRYRRIQRLPKEVILLTKS